MDSKKWTLIKVLILLGYFVNGEPHGHGTFTWPNGDKFEGEFRKAHSNIRVKH